MLFLFHYNALCHSSHYSIILQSLSIFSLSSLYLHSSVHSHSPTLTHLLCFPLIFSASLLDILWLLFTTPLLTLLTSSYFLPLCFFLRLFVSFLCTSDRECSIAAQLQVSAMQMLFSLSFLCMHGQHWICLCYCHSSTSIPRVIIPMPLLPYRSFFKSRRAIICRRASRICNIIAMYSKVIQ